MIKVGVLGAGSMGTGIAQVAAMSGHEVYIHDASTAAMEKSKDSLVKIFNRLVEKRKWSRDKAKTIFNKIKYVDKLADFADTSIVIEAIIERLDIKKSVFKELEGIVSDECVLASNTSSLSMAAIAAACELSDRVIGIHFFNPAPLMPLVEIIPAVQTAPETLEFSKNLIDSWGKTTVIAKDTPGFIVNRVARPFYGEALRIYEEGIADIPTIDWAMKEIGGFKMGPFTLMDYIGNDINYAVTESVFTAFYYDPRYKPAFTQKRMAEANFLGRKTGRGYYDYSEEANNKEATKDLTLGNKIVSRIVAMLINEAIDALYLNIASREDIDLAMTKGVNYPKGLIEWGEELGFKKVLAELDNLYNEYHEDRYRASVLLRKMAKYSLK